MIEKIQSLLEKQGYLTIESNVPFVKLFVQYELSLAKVIQMLDCVDEVPITVEQYTVFCQKSKEHIRDMGYETIEFLTLIVTPWISEARKFVLHDDHCWIVNSNNMSVILYDNEPNDFYGLRELIESESTADPNASDISSEKSGSYGYSGYYDNTPRQTKSFAQEFTPVNTALVIINIAVFAVMTFAGSTEDVGFMLGHGAMFVPSVLVNKCIYKRADASKQAAENINDDKLVFADRPFNVVPEKHQYDHVSGKVHEPEMQEHMSKQPIILIIVDDGWRVGSTPPHHIFRIIG